MENDQIFKGCDERDQNIKHKIYKDPPHHFEQVHGSEIYMSRPSRP